MMVMALLVAAIEEGTSKPFGSEAGPPKMETAVEVLSVDSESVSCTVAITPLGIVVLFSPYRRHRIAPDVGLQANILPASIATGAGFTLMAEMSAME